MHFTGILFYPELTRVETNTVTYECYTQLENMLFGFRSFCSVLSSFAGVLFGVFCLFV